MVYFSVSDWSQNDLLIPFTINSALQSPALDRTTADAGAKVTSQNYVLTSRPTPSSRPSSSTRTRSSMFTTAPREVLTR